MGKPYYKKTFAELDEKRQKMLGRPIREFKTRGKVCGIYTGGVAHICIYQVRAGSITLGVTTLAEAERTLNRLCII